MTAILSEPGAGSIDRQSVLSAASRSVTPARPPVAAPEAPALSSSSEVGAREPLGRHVRVHVSDTKAWDHRPDHSFLLTPVPRRTWANNRLDEATSRPDVIVVPTNRPSGDRAAGLSFALSLAERLGCHIVFLCSGDARTEDFGWGTVPFERVPYVHAIRFDQVHPEWWAAADLLDRHPSKYDVANKRNVAIAMAVALGWKQILFIDDDMEEDLRSDGLNAANVAHASEWMTEQGFAAVGWTCVDFPDNSTVCHARRLAGLRQSTFLGAGALLVAVDEHTPFFPDMYNEDWFFLIASALNSPDRLKAIGRAGAIHQVEYDPYVNSRVERQELGDVLAECLMNLLEDGELPAEDADFWRRALRSRAGQIAWIRTWLTVLMLGRRGQRRRRAAVLALRQAESVRRRIEPSVCAQWVADWRLQQQAWTAHLESLPQLYQGRLHGEVIGEICLGKPPRRA